MGRNQALFVYFDHVTMFKVLQHKTSIKGSSSSRASQTFAQHLQLSTEKQSEPGTLCIVGQITHTHTHKQCLLVRKILSFCQLCRAHVRLLSGTFPVLHTEEPKAGLGPQLRIRQGQLHLN